MITQPKLVAIAAALLTLASPLVEASARAPEPVADQPSEPTEPEPLTVNVDLVVDTLPKDARLEAAKELERQLAALAEDHDLVVVDRDAARLFIRLELNQPESGVDVFLVDVVAVYDGDVLPRQDAQACIQCTLEEMVHDGLEILPSALAQIERRRAEAAAAAARARAKAAAAEAPPPTPPPSASTRLGVAGYVGISSSAVGLGTTIAGAVLLGRGSDDPTGSGVEYVDYRPPGRALVGIGLGMMVVGTVLLAVDLGVLEDRRRATARVTLDSVSVATIDGPGLMVTGRF